MTMVNITQEDIDKGIRGMSNACAIARGLQRVDVFNKEDLKSVYVNGSQLFRVGTELYTLPKKAQAFIDQFDADKSKAKPFSFALRKYKGSTLATGFFTPPQFTQAVMPSFYAPSKEFSFKY